MKRYKAKEIAHRIGEGHYSYRGWEIYHNEELNKWFPISPNGESDFSCKTLNEAKRDIDGLIDDEFCNIVCG